MTDKIQLLCSCPDYFHKINKTTKKRVICKQCKGAVIPTYSVGTMRIFPTPWNFNTNIYKNGFATVRVPPTSAFEYQRPTILTEKYDPYNFLRRSRMLYTNHICDSVQHYNNSDPSNKFLVTLGHHQSDQSKRKLNQSFANFPSENYNCTFSQSSVNPYKLISTTLHDNEFSPSVKLFEPISTNDGVNNNSMKRISQKLISDKKDKRKQISKVDSCYENIISHISGTKSHSESNRSHRITDEMKKDSVTKSNTRTRSVQFNTLPDISFRKTLQNKIGIFRNEVSINEDHNLIGDSRGDLIQKTQKRSHVIRSMSDRYGKDVNHVLNFKDTTALRPRLSRMISANIFQKPNNLSYRRPPFPPPKLPESVESQKMPQRPPRQQRSTKKDDNISKNSDDEIRAARIFGLLPVSAINGTRIKTLPTLDTTTFSQNDNDQLLPSQIQKTLIKINSAESSTVNVNEKANLYHSSVLIKDDSDQNNLNMNKLFEHSCEVLSTKVIDDASDSTDMQEVISTNNNNTKTLICLNYGNNSGTVRTSDIQTSSNKCPSDTLVSTDSFILKLMNDPDLSHLLYGLDLKSIADIIENLLTRLSLDKSTSMCEENIIKKNNLFFKHLRNLIKEERSRLESTSKASENITHSSSTSFSASENKTALNSITVENCEEKSHKKGSLRELNESDRVQKVYEILADTSVWKHRNKATAGSQNSHDYECLNFDPIYEEINDDPPPLPTNPPPTKSSFLEKQHKSMFLGATKYDILSYLVDAKDRITIPEECYTFKFLRRSSEDCMSPEKVSDNSRNIRNMQIDKFSTSIERNDSGVGSETSKTCRTKYQPTAVENIISSIQLCEDCDNPIKGILEISGVYIPSTCCICTKKRAERREILYEFIETEKKYARDLQIIIDEFYQPMLVAGLLTQEQLSSIFLNIGELLENSIIFCGKIIDAFNAANEQADEDLFTVDIGKIVLDASSMLCAFETYCVQQAAAGLLLASVEKDKELLRIFLRVSQMENSVLRRMNLNSFLMVPVQRVTKYPLLLSRLYKATPSHVEGREHLKEAQDKIECHLNRMNREAKDISTKLWRRLSSNPLRSKECDLINIKLRRIAIDCLDWTHDKVHFIVEGKLLITHPTDNSWRKGKTIKLNPVNALLITNELASGSEVDHSLVNFPRYSINKEAAFLLFREKGGRYSIYREPFYLDRCVVCTESDLVEYFEVHEISSKDSFIFKAEDDTRTKHWYNQLQYHAQGTGAWRRRRKALSNIMINGMIRP